MRLKEKLETGNRTVFVGNLSVKTEKKVFAFFTNKFFVIKILLKVNFGPPFSQSPLEELSNKLFTLHSNYTQEVSNIFVKRNFQLKTLLIQLIFV